MEKIFRYPALSLDRTGLLLKNIQTIAPNVTDIKTELCFYVEPEDHNEPPGKNSQLDWLLKETYEPDQYDRASFLDCNRTEVIEIGPRIGCVTPWSTSAQAILEACNIHEVKRIEVSKRFCLKLQDDTVINEEELKKIKTLLHDKMTEEVYTNELKSFIPTRKPEPVQSIPILTKGAAALKDFIDQYGLQLTPDMQEYIIAYFIKENRDPTDVELFMFGQLNSEHCRHHIFNGLWVIDGERQEWTLMDMIRKTVKNNRGNLAVAFKDNAAILDPVKVKALIPSSHLASQFRIAKTRRGFVLKVETHNHPSTVSPYPGAATGVAVRRDTLGSGRGGIPVGHLAGYYFGHLFLPNYNLPWEKQEIPYSGRFASPLQIAIEASNGASDNCNCFGNPVILGTTRSFEQKIDGRHYGYRKTILLAGSFGYIDEEHIKKGEPEIGMLVVQTGGSSYPIGVGGGSGSSKDAGGQGSELDFNSVQRGDAFTERGNLNVIRTCSELGKDNPIITITDLGAGGDCVAIPELVFPAGAKVKLRNIPCGDISMPVWIYWCNESQERMAYLIHPDKLDLFREICERNRCQMAVIGEVTGDAKFILEDDKFLEENSPSSKDITPINLSMDWLLADLPRRTISCSTKNRNLSPPHIPISSLDEHLQLVLRLPDVASKEWLTRKADRTVGNRSIRQQEVGPLQLPLADCAVLSDGPFGKTGNIIAIGEQPIKGFVDNKAGARMSIGEALTNAVWAPWKKISDLNFSATWQWPCGQPGEDARLYEAVKTVGETLAEIGLRIGVGKDSLSMTLKETGNAGEIHQIAAPGTVQMVLFGPCNDINKVITPDIKRPGESVLIFIDLAKGKQRLGGSALLRVYEQIGDNAPDLDDALHLTLALEGIQTLIKRGLILSGHDRSDGGLITCLLEMAFAGNCGLDISVKNEGIEDEFFFNEELGLVIEVLAENVPEVSTTLNKAYFKDYYIIGNTIAKKLVSIEYNGQIIFNKLTAELMNAWRDTSFRLDELQSSPEIVKEWRNNTHIRPGAKYFLSFNPEATPKNILTKKNKPKAAILWEAGTNGERDAAESCYLAGFEAINIHATDLASGNASLKDCRFLVIPGGFAFRDTMGAGKGSAGVLKFNEYAADELNNFISRSDTLMFGPCNGCQEMALLGILPWPGIPDEKLPRFISNKSGRFEHQLVSLRILPSNSIFLRDMEGSTLGIIVSHAEGQYHCDNDIMNQIMAKNLAPLRYVDDYNEITEKYPFNPNGSLKGIAGLSSENGRFLAMMPHPERLPLLNLYPWIPQDWKNLKASPWLKMFQNAREWCS